ncbi:MAG: discoidin domain-containing protein [Armatimonadetes bacterium]|nr:discoidin domain-containing protein [Armatimonadota bacterium]
MFAFLFAAALQSPDLTLSRGAELMGPFAGVQQRYWDVSEAEIDGSAPESSIPNLFALTGSAQRKVLLRFGSLDLATIRNSKIVDGTLVLGIVDKDHAHLKAVKVVKRPWMTPGVNVLVSQIRQPEPQKTKDGKIITPFAPGVNWTKAGGDTANWQSPGASATSDAEAVDAKIDIVGDTIRVSNLGPTLQYWKTHEGDNFGFLLEFSDETGLYSSFAPEMRPSLEIKLASAEVKDPHFWVSHEGNSVSLHSTEPINSLEVYRGVEKVSSDKATTVQIATDNPSKDPRGRLTKLVASFDDPSIPQEVVTIDPTAPWVNLTPHKQRIWNRWTIDQSYYSFARYGAQKYVNGQGEQDGAWPPVPGVEAFANDSHRMDTMFLPGLPMPLRTTRNPLNRQMVNVESGPLSMGQVDFLVNGTPQYPKVILAKLTNYDGRPLVDASVKMTTSGSETTDLKSDKNGTILISKLPLGAVGDIKFTVTTNGRTSTLTTPATTFSDIFARGTKSAGTMDMPFNLPLWPIADDTNLVASKPVSDSANSFPAQLVALVDDNPDTTYTLPANGWVQVDLGRDRTVGEIVFQGEVPKQFRVLVFGTTDKPDDADWWIDEVNSERFRTEYEVEGDLTYRPSPNSARYIRIQNLTDKPATLKGIKVFAAKRPD